MNKFTVEEINFMCVFETQNRMKMMEKIRRIMPYIKDSDMEDLSRQAVTLFFVCLMIASVADIPQNIPIFMPLFVVAAMPVLFKSQLYGMSEIEAVTRASGAQIMLAKLVLAGSANLVCITIVLCLEVSLQNDCSKLGQMVLYCLVPYLVYIT